MSVASETFLHFRMEEEHYHQLSEDVRSIIEPTKVEVTNIDYSTDELWQSYKRESVKAYKKLKDREYDLRNSK
tara:strand:- start:541 stop:759 length:219 start_codon:yes stop_codon:yes gene_type:complete